MNESCDEWISHASINESRDERVMNQWMSHAINESCLNEGVFAVVFTVCCSAVLQGVFSSVTANLIVYSLAKTRSVTYLGSFLASNQPPIMCCICGKRPAKMRHCKGLCHIVVAWGECALQHTATHCNTPQHTATHCNTPRPVTC